MVFQARGFALAAVAALFWAFTGPGIGYMLTHYAVEPLTLAFWRDAFMVAVLLPITLWRFRVPGGADLRRFALVGAFGVGIYHALWVYSVKYNGAAIAVILIYTFPAWATLGAWLLWREEPSSSALVGLAFAFLGCALVVRAYDPEVLRLNWRGLACGLGTGVLQAAYSIFSRRQLHHHHPWAALTWTMLFGTIVLLCTQTPRALVAIGSDPVPWLIIAGLAIGPTLGGYLLYNLALRSLPAGVAGTVVTLEAPFAAVLAALLLGGQALLWPQLTGMLLVMLGAALPQLDGFRRRAKQNAAA